MKFRRTAISTPAAVAFALVLAIAVGAVVYAYTLHPASTTSVQTPTGVNTQAPPNPILGITVKSGNSLTAASVSETNAVYNFYSCSLLNGAPFSSSLDLYGVTPTISSLTKGTQSTTTLTSRDFSCGYGVLLIYAGDSTYTDTSKVLGGGNGVPISQYAWILGATKGREDLGVEVSYSALGSPNYQNSNQNLQFIYTNSEFVQTTLSSITVTDSYSGHNIASIGTAANTVTTVKWTIGGISSGDAAARSQLVVYSNDSTSAPVITSNGYGALSFGDNMPFNLPQGVASNNIQTSGNSIVGIGAGNELSLGYASTTRTYQFEYWPGNLNLDKSQVANAIMFDNPAQSVGDTTVSVPITTSFTATSGTGSDVGVSLSVTWIAGNGATTTTAANTVTLWAGTAL